MITERQLARYRGRTRGQICPVEILKIADLKLDSCQRMLDQGHAWRCVKKDGGINWHKFQPLDVVRKSTGQLTVINGQHRLEMLRMVLPDQETVQCRVIDTDDEREAAQYFADFNARGIKKVGDTDLLWAEIIAEDPKALKILRSLEKMHLSTGRINWQETTLSIDLASLRRCLQWGSAETERAVNLYKQAWPGERVINGDVLTGLVRLLTFNHYQKDLALTEQYGRDFDQWFVATFQHLSINRAKYTEYRNAKAGWYDGVAWGLLEDFTQSQFNKLKGAPDNRALREQHGNIKTGGR